MTYLCGCFKYSKVGMQILVGGEEIEVEVAESILSRAWGLSLRKEGKMLFKFPKPTSSSIDMMLLSKPLYLYFFDSDKELIYSEKAQPWSLSPKSWKLYRPEEKYQYLLESFEDLDLEEGEELELTD
jgi:uncharacterized membrane protein (UPF0127 family)